MPDAASRHIVTGRGPQGGPPRRDPWRGGRDGRPGRDRAGSPVEPRWPCAAVEVEELPTQVARARSTARRAAHRCDRGRGAWSCCWPAASGCSAVAGGTPASPPPASRWRRGRRRAEPDRPPPVPRVTPWAACGPSRTSRPSWSSRSTAVQTPGRSSSPDVRPGATFERHPPGIGAGRTWTIPSRCRWTPSRRSGSAAGPARSRGTSSSSVGVPGGLRILESWPTRIATRAVAPEPVPGLRRAVRRRPQLRAILVSRSSPSGRRGPIHVPPLEPPTVTLSGGRSARSRRSSGCDVTQRLVNGCGGAAEQCDAGRPARPEQRGRGRPARSSSSPSRAGPCPTRPSTAASSAADGSSRRSDRLAILAGTRCSRAFASRRRRSRDLDAGDLRVRDAHPRHWQRLRRSCAGPGTRTCSSALSSLAADDQCRRPGLPGLAHAGR